MQVVALSSPITEHEHALLDDRRASRLTRSDVLNPPNRTSPENAVARRVLPATAFTCRHLPEIAFVCRTLPEFA
jgi:hypothetical protein